MIDSYLETLNTYPALGYVFIGILGLVFGSFFTFLFYRLRAGEPWLWGDEAKRSKCPSCGTILSVRDLIPVLSWAINKGRCRYCNTPISIRYPLIEITTAAIFLLIYSIYQG